MTLHLPWIIPTAWLALTLAWTPAWTLTAKAVFWRSAGFSFLVDTARGSVRVYWRRSRWLFWLPPMQGKCAITLRTVVVVEEGWPVDEALVAHEHQHVRQQFRHATPAGGFIDQLRNLAALEADAERVEHEHQSHP